MHKALSLSLSLSLSFVHQVTEGTDDEAPTLPTEKLRKLPANAPEGTACFSVALSSPLSKSSKTTTLDVLTVFTRAQAPHPARIATGQQQRVVLLYSATVPSPYAIEKQQTVVRMPGKVESYENADGPPEGDAAGASPAATLLSHGPTSEPRAPFSLSPGRVHFVNNAPFAHAERLEREVEVSHWGNVAVRERFRPLANVGAEHRGEWSRLDFSANAEATNPAALQALGLVLPPQARWFSFRDEIGNISSSNMRGGVEAEGVVRTGGKLRRKKSRKVTPVEGALYPRYPLAGGWRAAFEFGWSIPLNVVAAELTSEDRRASLEREETAPVSAAAAALSGRRVRLTLPSFFTPVRDVVADELSVVLVLPEGASRVAHYLPFEVDSAILGKKATYLDTTGRTTLTLNLKNVVEDHGAPLVVEYSLPRWRPAAEPLMVVAAVASVIAAVFLSSRVDLSLDGGGGGGDDDDEEEEKKKKKGVVGSKAAKAALAKAS
jgi:oligosaccharyltransferase complex subunit alpha (ribophorin I)